VPPEGGSAKIARARARRRSRRSPTASTVVSATRPAGP